MGIGCAEYTADVTKGLTEIGIPQKDGICHADEAMNALMGAGGLIWKCKRSRRREKQSPVRQGYFCTPAVDPQLFVMRALLPRREDRRNKSTAVPVYHHIEREHIYGIKTCTNDTENETTRLDPTPPTQTHDKGGTRRQGKNTNQRQKNKIKSSTFCPPTEPPHCIELNTRSRSPKRLLGTLFREDYSFGAVHYFLKKNIPRTPPAPCPPAWTAPCCRSPSPSAPGSE